MTIKINENIFGVRRQLMISEKEQALEKLKEIIWNDIYHQMTSYKLLSKYLESDGKYDKPVKFEELLRSLKSCKDIFYDKDSDIFTLYKPITIPIYIDSFCKRQNCYGCHFRVSEEDNERKFETVLTCALNPFIHPQDSMDGLRGIKCPINERLEELKNNEN